MEPHLRKDFAFIVEYKKTLNLPKTKFPIKADLKSVEEELISFWQEEKVYEEREKKNEKLPKYILHDGPPYANGDIHLGHAINKILKDIVVKYKSMSGFLSPFVPGWDCHGLPIETQLIKEQKLKRFDTDRKDFILEFRRRCKEYALKYVDVQRREFIRLGVFGEWLNPYLTLNPVYEAKIVEIFGILAEQGYVYRGLKPIHWCPNCETALAEAEIEYEDEKSPSIYVKFNVQKIETDSPVFKQIAEVLAGENSSIVIWTTTPWTLPANVAVAVNPKFDYVALKIGAEVYVVAEGLMDDFIKRLDLRDHKVLAKFKGEMLEGIILKHPFMDRSILAVLDDEAVTLEQGTGIVHIAPGHGGEDFKIGTKYKLPTIMPVDERGYFTKEAGKYAGKRYDESNKLITDDMRDSGALLYLEFIKHSYPHCWRCKKPVIFRATEQWFISVDHKDMRRELIKAVGDTKWFPAWGENRIRGMVESRPDWCISRQRAWGVPIPAFYCVKCGKPQMTGAFNKAIKELFSAEGSDGWFKKEANEILKKETKCPECGSEKFKKETDILDVWFESGASHYAVLEEGGKLRWPSDLYLEGSDQHRGWFQTSLITSVGAKGRAPYDAVLTHGFTVDEKGRKMSKSLGNVVDPQDVVKRFGADVLRLWVASTDFRIDMSASENILKQINEAYTKIRNTCRFLLSNLSDFDPKKDTVKYEDLLEIDKFALLKFGRLVERIRLAYDNFEFHVVFHSIRDFSINDMSALYLDIVKDRLYCSGKTSKERRSSQTVMHIILTNLVKLFTPILTFTAEDIWRYTPQNNGSVYLEDMPKVEAEWLDEELEKKWDEVLEIREDVYKEIELKRANKEINSPLEAEIELYADGETLKLLQKVGAQDFSMIFINSEVKVLPMKSSPDTASLASKVDNLRITVKKSGYKKCERCWNYRDSVGKNDKHKTLCSRCVKIVEEIQ